MSEVKVTVRGKDKLFDKLRRLAPEAFTELKAANGKAAEAMVGYARDFVAVKTGKLRDSIVATPPGGTAPSYSQGNRIVPEGSWMVTAGNSGVRYAHLVEFGTKPHFQPNYRGGFDHPGAKAQPFFWPSYRLVRKSMRSRATRALNASIKRAVH